MIRFLAFILICCIIAALCSCAKVDVAYLNTDRRTIEPNMIRVSKWFDYNWKFKDSSFVRVAYNPALIGYADTTIFPITCPPPNGIEIRYYKIQ